MDIMKAFWRGFGRNLVTRRQESEPGAPPPGQVLEPIKEPPMEIDGRVLTAQEFVSYVESLEFPSALPTRIFLHHTWRPTLDTWHGEETILGMKAYYERQLWTDSTGREHEGWTAGPHLFVADDGIWLFSDLRYDGVGAYGHNYRSRHLEMVGNYDAERPSGAVLNNTITALGILSERLVLDVQQLNFHRDYSTKSCPGWAVTKDWIIPQVAAWVEDYRGGREEDASALRQALVGIIDDLLQQPNPDAALAKESVTRGLLGALTSEIPMEIDGEAYVAQIFADALIVPMNEWDQVRSLREYERDARDSRLPTDSAGSKGTENQARQLVPPSEDPFTFEGKPR